MLLLIIIIINIIVYFLCCASFLLWCQKLDNRAQDNGIIIIIRKTIHQFIFSRARPRDRFMSYDVCSKDTPLVLFLLTKKKRNENKQKNKKQNTYENENQQRMREKDMTKRTRKVYQNTERSTSPNLKVLLYAPNNSNKHTGQTLSQKKKKMEHHQFCIYNNLITYILFFYIFFFFLFFFFSFKYCTLFFLLVRLLWLHLHVWIYVWLRYTGIISSMLLVAAADGFPSPKTKGIHSEYMEDGM